MLTRATGDVSALARVVLLAAVVSSGCSVAGTAAPSSEGPSASPSVVLPSPSSPVPTGTPGLEGLPSDLSDAVRSRAWASPVRGVWTVGRYGGRAEQLPWDVDEAAVFASWGRAVAVRTDTAEPTVSIIDLETGDIRDVATLAEPVGSFWASTSPNGETVYVHDSVPGLDRGLQSVDVATGSISALTAVSSVEGRTERSWMLWSPSGNTLVSMLCDLEVCVLDVADAATGATRRLDVEFAAWAITDSYAFGQTRKEGGQWATLDLASGDVRELPPGLVIQVSGLLPIAGDRFLVDTGLEVVSIDASGNDHRVLLSEAVPSLTALVENQFNPVPGAMLLVPGEGGGVSMSDVVANRQSVYVLAADGRMFESAIPPVPTEP